MRLAIIQLNSPYETLGLPASRKYFAENLWARIKSYQSRYGEVVLPLGVEDFVSDHFLIVDQHLPEISRVLGTFKILSFNTCQKFSIPFPLLHTLSHPSNPSEYYQMAQQKLEECERSGQTISYIGGMTVSDELRNDPEKRTITRDLIAAAQVYAVLDREYSQLLVTGTIPNKSFEYLEWMGLTRFRPESVTVWSVGQTTAYIMHLQQWSAEVLALAARYESVWQEREIIEVGQVVKIKKAA